FLRALGPPEARLGVAIERGKAFLAAGADCVFVPGVRDRETIAAVVSGIGGPVNILAVEGTPPVAELEALGVARVSVGSGPMRATMALGRGVARELKTSGTYAAFTAKAMAFADVNELMKCPDPRLAFASSQVSRLPGRSEVRPRRRPSWPAD